MYAGTLNDNPTSAPRRANDARVGMMIFLGSWGMTFLTLFFSYAVLRIQSPVWPPADVPPIPSIYTIFAWINTALVLASSFSVQSGMSAIDSGNPRRLLTMLGGTILCGLVFLVLQINTWTALWRPGMRMQDGTYQGLFYLLTIFHALHVAAGILLYIWALPAARALALRSSRETAPRDRIRLNSVAMFWHFVSIAWIATFTLVYII